MKAIFSDGNTLAAPKSLSLHERYLHVIQIVASVWTLLSLVPTFFWMNLPKTSAMYVKLKFMTGGCLFVAFGIYSLLFPLYYVWKRHGESSNHS
jgi:hypothetical protein